MPPRLAGRTDGRYRGHRGAIVALVALDVVLYVALAFAILRHRRRMVNASNLADAFNGLEKALKQAVPDLPSVSPGRRRSRA